jgi:hypothetical protein
MENGKKPSCGEIIATVIVIIVRMAYRGAGWRFAIAEKWERGKRRLGVEGW